MSERTVGELGLETWLSLIADTEDELHAFAALIGMRRSWAQMSRSGVPHYDLVAKRRAAAVAFGAVTVSRLRTCNDLSPSARSGPERRLLRQLHDE